MTQEKYIDRVSKLHPDIINNFLTTGECSAVPVKIQRYIQQISWAAEIWEFERNLTAASKELRVRIAGTQGVNMSLRECREKINDALNFFSVNSNVKQDVWDLHTADNLAALGKMAVAKGDVKTALKAEQEANFYRNRASQSNNIGTKVVNFLLTKNLKDEDLGFNNKSLKKIAKKSTDGFYVKLINDLPTDADKKRELMSDADISDAEIIESN